MTFILLLLFQFSAFTQKDIYSLTDEKTKGTPTVRLRPSRFLVYQSHTISSRTTNIPKEFSDGMARNRDQVTQSNIIPIGILNADIETPNTDKKEKKKDFVLMASPIQKDIFQANIQFQISPKLLKTNLDNKIESIEISFDNGDNWKLYKYEEQLINYQFKETGEQEIGFKINSKKGTFITFATVDVKQLIRPSFVETNRVSAPAIKGGRVAGNVNGAEYRIHLGCDGLFDKPIIIAEGYDVNQDINLDDLTAKYFNALQLYRNNGYDLVLVNYDNARTWIQDNAQVLKAVINQVNATKIGNNKLVVIGESMSGLVARWALKEMENSGQNPNVSHFVAFDTPMKGANVPSGFIGLRRWFSTTELGGYAELLDDLFGAFPALRALDEPAAKQMLLTQQGSSPAPDFFQFQTAINNLGYPSQYGIKNIALINGALNGTPQRRFNAQSNGNGTYSEIDQGQLNDGDRIFDYSIWSYLDAVAWTHRRNVQDSYVAFGNEPLAIFKPAVRFYHTSPINYDIHPGGRIVSTTGSVYTNFSFVPTFSSIDYRGPLNNDNDYYFSTGNFINGNFQVTNNTLTPFAAIYGNNVNNFHALPASEQTAFNDFGRIELGMIDIGGCRTCNFVVSATANPSIISCEEGTSTLAASCSGLGCFGVSYAWSNNTTGSPVYVTLPNSNGTVGYTLTASKSGCSTQTVSTSVTVTGCSGGGGGNTNPDRTEGGIASDGGANNLANEGEARAFDNQNNTKWLLFNPTGNIAYDFAGSDAYAINQYTVTSANDDPTRDPQTWNLQGSNDGSNWTTVDAQNNQLFSSRFQTKTYNFSNSVAYQQYRLNVTANRGSGLLQIAEIQMFGASGTSTGGSTGGGYDNSACSYTEGQFLFNWYGENVYAHQCGTKYYVTTDAGSGGVYKPRHWLVATNYAQANCFEQDDPRPAGCTGTGGDGGGTGTGTGGCSFTDGQYLLDHNGETIQAKFCNGVLYARATWGAWKHPNWLIGAGMNPTTAACFATYNPGCGALRMAAINADEKSEPMNVYPNPTDGKITVDFWLEKDENIWLNLYDTQGKSLHLKDYQGQRGNNQVILDLQDYPSGAYFLNLQSAGRQEVKKIIKIK
jgi:hypothetical protein